MTVVKICGITEEEHALYALEAGADLLGFVFAPSRRQLSADAAARIIEVCRRLFPPKQRPWQAVGVFANQPMELVLATSKQCRLDVVQLSGREPADYCARVPLPVFKAVHVPETTATALCAPLGLVGGTTLLRSTLRLLKEDYAATRLVLDSGGTGQWGGSGKPFPWESVGDAARDCLVAGGLNPENVAEAIAVMRPWGVDTSSGVETNGRKDPHMIRRFINAVRRCDTYASH